METHFLSNDYVQLFIKEISDGRLYFLPFSLKVMQQNKNTKACNQNQKFLKGESHKTRIQSQPQPFRQHKKMFLTFESESTFSI